MDVAAQFVDVAAGGCHKWLLAPEGIGFLYISDRARARIHPTLVGWVSVKNPEDYNNFDQEWKEGALPWETGTGPTSLFYGLEAGQKILQGVGVERIKTYLFELADSLCEELTARGYEIVSSRHPGEKSQIVCIKPKPEWTPMSVYVHLKRQNVIVAPRGDRVRISPHFYNDQSDIDAFVSALP
jgi:selenocysteine lyase/cysteine desulfurase